MTCASQGVRGAMTPCECTRITARIAKPRSASMNANLRGSPGVLIGVVLRRDHYPTNARGTLKLLIAHAGKFKERKHWAHFPNLIPNVPLTTQPIAEHDAWRDTEQHSVPTLVIEILVRKVLCRFECRCVSTRV
jgi:hypothetical protein